MDLDSDGRYLCISNKIDAVKYSVVESSKSHDASKNLGMVAMRLNLSI